MVWTYPERALKCTGVVVLPRCGIRTNPMPGSVLRCAGRGCCESTRFEPSPFRCVAELLLRLDLQINDARTQRLQCGAAGDGVSCRMAAFRQTRLAIGALLRMAGQIPFWIARNAL